MPKLTTPEDRSERAYHGFDPTIYKSIANEIREALKELVEEFSWHRSPDGNKYMQHDLFYFALKELVDEVLLEKEQIK